MQPLRSSHAEIWCAHALCPLDLAGSQHAAACAHNLGRLENHTKACLDLGCMKGRMAGDARCTRGKA